MKRIFIISTILLFTLSCKDKVNNKTEKTYYKNGKLAEEISYTSDSTAVVHSYYENGNIATITSYTYQNKDGFYMAFYESGRLAERGFYKNNKEDGAWYLYSKNGLLLERKQLGAIPTDDGSIAKEMIYYTPDMNLDTTKTLCYVETKSFIDTIYKGELYLLKLKLHKPYFKNGSMTIMLVDDHSKYYDLSKIDTFENLIHCKGFEHLLQITDYKIGNNTINGVIINYDESGKLTIPYYFTQNFYVKELPR